VRSAEGAGVAAEASGDGAERSSRDGQKEMAQQPVPASVFAAMRCMQQITGGVIGRADETQSKWGNLVVMFELKAVISHQVVRA
jgi:hypothetical protein